MNKFLISFSLISAVFLIACQDRSHLSPIGPSETGVFTGSIVQDTVSKWSPYIGIHATGEAMNAYRDALTLLKKAGGIKGVRVEIIKREGVNPVIKMIGSLGGIDILALISNDYLINNPNLEQDIDQIFTAYPEIHYFQVGNEFTTIVSGNGGPPVTIEEYMASLKRIYDHVQVRYPGRVVLVSQSTLGSDYGAKELEKMINLGLTQMSPNNLILAINNYGPDHSGEYAGLLSGPLRQYRVWVTETGVRDPSLHISYVQNSYPQIQNNLRAERIYWYVMWGGNADTDFSLIKEPGSFPNYWKSPLFKLLTGSN